MHKSVNYCILINYNKVMKLKHFILQLSQHNFNNNNELVCCEVPCTASCPCIYSNVIQAVTITAISVTQPVLSIIEPRYETTGFRYIDTTIHLLSKSEISSSYPSSVAVEPGLCRTLSETPKTGFLTTSLNYNKLKTRDIRYKFKMFKTFDVYLLWP